MEFIIKYFNDLSASELYLILKLRNNVFVIEQNCIYEELDGIDKFCYHIFLFEDEECVATSRIVPPEIKYKNYASIGRVCTSFKNRKNGLGRYLMEYSIIKTIELFPSNSIKISAQLYLKQFYESFRFIKVSDAYDEDGIMHIDMLRDLSV